jgi:hypothetical protein
MPLLARTGSDSDGGQASVFDIATFPLAPADAALDIDVSLDSDLVLQT